jgi:serpin B
MPKFELRYRCDLVDNLRQLGVSEPFSSGADFSAMSKLPISISAVLHESFIRVDEKGTEAAAATAVMMTRSAAFLEQPKVVNIDRPFVIILIEKGSRVPLFLGVIGEPKL